MGASQSRFRRLVFILFLGSPSLLFEAMQIVWLFYVEILFYSDVIYVITRCTGISAYLIFHLYIDDDDVWIVHDVQKTLLIQIDSFTQTSVLKFTISVNESSVQLFYFRFRLTAFISESSTNHSRIRKNATERRIMLSAGTEVPSNPEDAEPQVVLSLDAEIRSAIHRGDEAHLRKIIESGTRGFDDADGEGCYMLQWAALSNQIEIIR